MSCIETIIMAEMDRVPEHEDYPIHEDTRKLMDLLSIVELTADCLPDNVDTEEYIVSFRTLGEHDGEHLLSRIRKLATKQLFHKNGQLNGIHMEQVRQQQYSIGPIEWENNKWSIGAIYTSKGVVYFNSP